GTPTAAPTATVTAPGAPTGITAQGGEGFIALAWSAPADDGGAAISEYVVRWSAGANSMDWQTPQSTGAPALSYTLRNLRSATTYSAQVAARNSGGLGVYSASAQAVTADFDIDVDDSGGVDWEDGVMIARYLAGARGAALVTGMTGAPNAGEVALRIESGRDILDVDGENGVTASDGIMIARFLLGVESGAALVEGMTDASNLGDVINAIRALPMP
ncbi:MAG: fibronectin type III domain-containing protein, partial [Gammaproteobacteria bacterium]